MFSKSTIDALTFAISGGPGRRGARLPIGRYRSKIEINDLLHRCGIDSIVFKSREDDLRQILLRENDIGEFRIMKRLVEAAADPKDFRDHPDRYATLTAYLARHLKADGFTLRTSQDWVRLVRTCATVGVQRPPDGNPDQAAVGRVTGVVAAALEQALGHVNADPARAIAETASAMEELLRSILESLGHPVALDRDLRVLYDRLEPTLTAELDQGYSCMADDEVRGLIYRIVATLETGRKANGSISPASARMLVRSAGPMSGYLIEAWRSLEGGRGFSRRIA